MKRIHIALSACVVLLGAACDPSTTGTNQQAPGPAGNKADDADGDLASDCMAFEFDYVECQDNAPKDVSCEALLNDEHPEAIECCGDPDGWAFCDLSNSGWCMDLMGEHIGCTEHAPPEVLCDELTDERPLAPLCGDERFATCDYVEARFRECEPNATAEICRNFVADFYPGSDTCCGGEDDYDHCVAFPDEPED